ncbi:MAG TPA: O-antigen ligase family protein [Solirubrobacterales bacterium]|nr:O-antigen ligase family protein [Solirubrobacterales bacterium]
MSDVLNAAGVLLAAAAGAAAILLPPGRLRAAAMLLALVLFPALILGDRWHSHQIVDLRDHPARLAGLGAAALVAGAALAAAFRRWPRLLPLAIVFALPFRVPLHAGGDTANLLVPLYLVIAGGVLALAVRDLRSRPAGEAPDRTVPAATGPAGRLPLVLAAVVVLYALQALYSPDFSKSLQNVCFFFVPFSLVYALLRDVSWDRKLLALVLWVVALEGVVFVLVGSIEYASRNLFWNPEVIRSNEFHTYFRVNSVFWDPNIYGRWLALAIVLAMAALLWARERRNLALLVGLVAVLWLGLVPTFSQSSFIALLVGLAVLGALRWSWRWALGGIAAFAVLAVLVVLLSGSASRISFSRLNIDTSGRAHLVSGGLRLFSQRPLYGYGAGSFPRAYKEHAMKKRRAPVSVSHTEPITVAAEQGVIGLIAYAALLITALWTMSSGLFVSRAGGAAGGTAPEEASATAGGGGSPAATGPARPAVLAVFLALLAHTMAYAGFFEDPIAWVLLAVGASLAAVPRSAPPHSLDPCRATSAA